MNRKALKPTNRSATPYCSSWIVILMETPFKEGTLSNQCKLYFGAHSTKPLPTWKWQIKNLKNNARNYLYKS